MLTAMVIVIELAFFEGVPFTSIEGRIAEQKEEVFKGLDQIADRKKDDLLLWINERRGDTLVAARNPSIESNVVHLRQRVSELTETGTDELEAWSLLSQDETYQDFAGYLRTIMDTYGIYEDIQIADAETGIVIVSTDDSTLGTDLSNESFFINALLSPIVFISDFTTLSEDVQPTLHFSHIVFDGQGGVTGVLVMRVKPGVILESILQAGPFLGESGEALLVNENTEILAPLKYPLADGTAVKLRQFKIEALPAVLASRGEEGIVETLDYRGVKVLAAYRYIKLNPDWGWGMVVKRDYTELFAPIRQEIYNAVIFGFVSLVVIIVVTILITRSITEPIRSLKTTAERITGGDLDARSKIRSSDEIGTLARAFNQMAESLVMGKTGLEEKVREGTKELVTEMAERVRVEDMARESGARFRSVFSQAPVGIKLYNLEGNLIDANQECLNIFGVVQVEDVMGFKLFEDPNVSAEAKIKLENGEMVDYESEFDFELVKKLGLYKTTRTGKCSIHVQITPYEIPGLGKKGFVAHVQDISERVQAETALKEYHNQLTELIEERTAQLNVRIGEVEALNQGMVNILEDLQETNQSLIKTSQQLEAANKELDAFSYSVSHDLRAPLRAIDAFTGILMNEYVANLDSEGNRLGSIIQKNTQKMGQLIDDLLAFSRLGRVSTRYAEIDMKKMVNAIYHEATDEEARSRITCSIADLPNPEGDPNMMRQVWMNLISNAVKFSAHRKPAVISVSCQEEGNKFVFQRLHSEREFEGTGVGLALTQRIIHRHGGEIWAEGEVDNGAVFYFSLPRNRRS